MEGQSKIQFISIAVGSCILPSIIFRNDGLNPGPDPFATKRYITLKDVRLLQCSLFSNIDNRSYRAIVSYGLKY